MGKTEKEEDQVPKHELTELARKKPQKGIPENPFQKGVPQKDISEPDKGEEEINHLVWWA